MLAFEFHSQVGAVSFFGTSSREAEPSDYLLRLLKQTITYSRDHDLPRDLTDCNATMAGKVKALAESAASKLSSELAEQTHNLALELSVLPRFQERLALAVNYTPSKWLLEWEQPYIKARREMQGLETADAKGAGPDGERQHDVYEWAADQDVRGICLSGGGIRSATFNLGVLQGLARLGLLKNFDYLSSVSGGGYIHEFLAAWIKREEGARMSQPGYTVGAGFQEVAKQLDPLPNQQAAPFHPEPIKWLRRYSNYLTPQMGMFSTDTWVAIAIWLRNSFLNQIVLLSGLMTLVLLARFVTLGLAVRIDARWLAGIAGFCFLLVAIYLGIALRSEYARIRRKDMERTGEVVLKPIAQWDWIAGQSAAVALGVAPFLITACFSLLTVPTTGEWVWAGVPEVFLGLFVVALVTVFAGGAGREHALLAEERIQNRTGVAPATSKQSRLASGGIWLCLYSFGAALLGTLAFFVFCWLLHRLFLWRIATYGWKAVVVLGPPLLLAVPFLTLVFGAGLVGRDFADWMREWLARLRAWSLIVGLFWIASFATVLLGPVLVNWLVPQTGPWLSTLKWSSLVVWVATTAGSLMAGKSAKTSGTKNETQASSALDLLAVVGPYVYIVGLLVALAWVADWLSRLSGAETWGSNAVVLGIAIALFVIFGLRVDVNEFSLNSFYRNRLTRCYLGASNFCRRPSPMTGFDDRDTAGMQISRLLPKTPPAMMERRPERDHFVPYTGPFPIICSTLNLTFGEDLAWQERKAASFAFTPLYSGYTVGWTAARHDALSFNGFVPTFNYAFPDGGINIGTAVAISGAAASPNWGYHTNPATAFLMTMFDVRLGWWIRNPRRLTNLAGFPPLVRERMSHRASPRFAPFQLAKELLGMTNDTSDYVYLSDGGHFDNMGLYELVRRRCYSILICDGEEDGNYVFDGLAMAIRKCRIDFGVEITLGDLNELRPNPPELGYSHAHFARGTIRYPETDGKNLAWKEGRILYLKSSLTGAATSPPSDTAARNWRAKFSKLLCSQKGQKLEPEPADILNYKLQHPKFPHDPTLNQWFTESQFESYRRLGCHVVEEIQRCGQWEVFKPHQ